MIISLISVLVVNQRTYKKHSRWYCSIWEFKLSYIILLALLTFIPTPKPSISFICEFNTGADAGLAWGSNFLIHSFKTLRERMSKMHQGNAALLNVNLRLCLCSGRNRDSVHRHSVHRHSMHRHSVHRHSVHRHSGHRHVDQASRTVPIVTMWKHF